MSCLINSGYSKICDVPAGARRLLVINYADVDTITYSNGQITALTLKTNKSAYSFNVEREVTKCECNAIGTLANGSAGYEHKISTKLHGFDSTTIQLTDILHKARVVVIVELNDGQYEVFFHDKGAKATVKRVNDAEYSGFNGFEVEWTHRQVDPSAEVSGTIVNSLTIV